MRGVIVVQFSRVKRIALFWFEYDLFFICENGREKGTRLGKKRHKLILFCIAVSLKLLMYFYFFLIVAAAIMSN